MIISCIMIIIVCNSLHVMIMITVVVVMIIVSSSSSSSSSSSIIINRINTSYQQYYHYQYDDDYYCQQQQQQQHYYYYSRCAPRKWSRVFRISSSKPRSTMRSASLVKLAIVYYWLIIIGYLLTIVYYWLLFTIGYCLLFCYFVSQISQCLLLLLVCVVYSLLFSLFSTMRSASDWLLCFYLLQHLCCYYVQYH